MYTMVLADALKRYRVLRGGRALLCTGTDEHGTKIQRAAAQSDMEPKQLCDANSAVFADLAQTSQIDNDFFVRTTDEDHKDAVRYFWDTLVRRGHIYEDKHAGWYCVSDETFYPESLIEKRMDPVTGRVFLASKESGGAVEWVEEKTYQFRMTAFRDRLLDWYKENPDWVVPHTRMLEVEDWVRNNLEDLSVSRPVSRLSWGIPVPDDPSQTIYVWLDALVNYITKAGYPGWAPGCESEGGWPADIHVVGKDIVRFHCVYWPALLMAADLPLPRKVLTHGHWTLSNRKMSKSVGNVVNPFLAIDRFGVDAVRFFLLSPASISDDADYSNELVVDKYKKQLQFGLGNLLGRVTRSKRWNVGEKVARACAHPADSSLPSQHEVLTKLPGAVEKHFEQPEPSRALREIIGVVMQVRKTDIFLALLCPLFPLCHANNMPVNELKNKKKDQQIHRRHGPLGYGQAPRRRGQTEATNGNDLLLRRGAEDLWNSAAALHTNQGCRALGRIGRASVPEDVGVRGRRGRLGIRCGVAEPRRGCL